MMFFYISCDCNESSAVAATGTPTAARHGKTDCEYEGRRLQEQRAMIAERKRRSRSNGGGRFEAETCEQR